MRFDEHSILAVVYIYTSTYVRTKRDACFVSVGPFPDVCMAIMAEYLFRVVSEARFFFHPSNVN